MASVTERAILATPIPTGRGGLITPFQFAFTGEDRLRVTVYGAVPGAGIKTTWRFIDPDRSTPVANSDEFISTGLGGEEFHEISIGNGAITNLVVRVTKQIAVTGDIWCRVDVVRGDGLAATVLGTMIAGYIGSAVGRAWPGSPLEGPTEGSGHIKLVLGTFPAAGANPVVFAPDYCRWRVMSVGVGMTADGTAGNRNPYLQIIQSSTLVFQSASSYNHPPFGIAAHYWGAGIGQAFGCISPAGEGSIPVDFYVSTQGAQDAVVQVATVGFAAGDQYQTLKVMVEEWRNPATTAIA